MQMNTPHAPSRLFPHPATGTRHPRPTVRAAFGAVIASALLLAGCGPAPSPANPTSAAAATAPAKASAATVASPDASAAPAASPAAGSAPAQQVPARSLGKLAFGLAVAQTFEFLPAFAAEDLGTWKKRGLDVAITPFAGDAPLQQAFAAGSVNVGASAVTGLVAAVDKGLDVRLIGAISNKIALMGLVVNPNEIKSKDDLKGKTIGVTSPNAPTDVLVRLLSKDLTGDPDNGIKRARLGGFDTQLAALKTNQTQGFVWTLDGIYTAEKQGAGKFLLSFGDIVPDFAFEMLMASNKTITERPEAVRAFLEGWFEAQDRIKSDQQYTANLFASAMQGDNDVGASVWQADNGNLEPHGVFDDRALTAAAQSMVDAGVITAVPALERWVDRTFLPVNWK